MGRIVTPRYAMHVTVDHGAWTPSVWRARAQYGVPGYGKPTDANLARQVAILEASTEPGGVNAHLGATRILSAYIVDYDRDDAVVATYRAS